jgi:hypothetical protein
MRPQTPPRLSWRGKTETAFKDELIQAFLQKLQTRGTGYYLNDQNVVMQISDQTNQESLAAKYVIVQGASDPAPTPADFPGNAHHLILFDSFHLD